MEISNQVKVQHKSKVLPVSQVINWFEFFFFFLVCLFPLSFIHLITFSSFVYMLVFVVWFWVVVVTACYVYLSSLPPPLPPLLPSSLSSSLPDISSGQYLVFQFSTTEFKPKQVSSSFFFVSREGSRTKIHIKLSHREYTSVPGKVNHSKNKQTNKEHC